MSGKREVTENSKRLLRLFGIGRAQSRDGSVEVEPDLTPPFKPPKVTVSPVVAVEPLGQLANRMIQHMVAMSIVSRVPLARISRIHLPEWGMEEKALTSVPEPVETVSGNLVPIDEIASRLQSGDVGTVKISGYAQNMHNLLPPDAYRALFRAGIPMEGCGSHQLLISLRMLEILSGNYAPYVLVPITFYRDIVDQTGLEPIFFGQLSECSYLDDLRAAFPDATFVHGSGVIDDYERIRRSKNILISVSTFAWVAAWLSEAERIIMPLTGLFNPVFAHDICNKLDLVPRNDPRYEFYLFPVNVAIQVDQVTEVHRALDGRWRKVTAAEIDEILLRHRSVTRRLDDFLAVFDEDYYLRAYPDLQRLVQQGFLSSGRDHYIAHGFGERRLPFHLEWSYLYRYPDSGEAIANGEFQDLIHFHASRGASLGYAPV